MSGSNGHDPKMFSLICLFSLTVHVVVFAGAFWLHDSNFLPPKPNVVRVDLVSFSPGPQSGDTLPQTPEPTPREQEPVKQESAKVEPIPIPQEPANKVVKLDRKPALEQTAKTVPVPVLTPDISLKSKPKNIKALMAERKKKEKTPEKKKTPESEKEQTKKQLKAARQELGAKLEAKNRARIDQALKRMQKAVAGKGSGPKTGPGFGAGKGTVNPDDFEIYKMKIAMAIRNNWIFSDTMAGLNQDLEVKIFVKVLRSGEIRDISYETRSGNKYLDESAKKAISRANPLPEFPKGMPVPSYEFLLGFTPKGLK